MPPDVKHAPEGTWESERGFGEGEGACIDLDMAVMLREETRKVQQLMEELFFQTG